MKNKFSKCVITPTQMVLDNGDKNPSKTYIELTSNQKIAFSNFLLLCNEISTESQELIPIPDEPSLYTMIKPCPINGDLDVLIWETSYVNDKVNKVMNISIVALHFDSDGNRVPIYDCKSYVIADMSEERKVEVSEGVYEYSYTLANTMLDNGEPVKTLLAKAIQIADADGSLNQRLYFE